MTNKPNTSEYGNFELFYDLKNKNFSNFNFKKSEPNLPEILFISSFPPRECGIATYTEDLIFALNNKFEKSFNITVAALELTEDTYKYGHKVGYILKTDNQESYLKLAQNINNNPSISIVVVEHEFGLFRTNESDFIHLLKSIQKPIIVALHTVLPNPNLILQKTISAMDESVDWFIVMTHSAANLLLNQ